MSQYPILSNGIRQSKSKKSSHSYLTLLLVAILVLPQPFSHGFKPVSYVIAAPTPVPATLSPDHFNGVTKMVGFPDMSANYQNTVVLPAQASCQASGGTLQSDLTCYVPPAPVPAAQPAPVSPATPQYSDSLADWLLKLRTCESGGNYAEDTGNGYMGAYEFSLGTWASLNTGYSNPASAPPAVQDQAIITNTNRSAGGLSSQNPGCYHKTGISNFPPGN